MALAEKLNEINNKVSGNDEDSEEKKSCTVGVFILIGFVTGIGLAYMRRKGPWAYAGYGFVGLIAGGFVGRTVTIVR